MYAVIKTGGKQYKVQAGDTIRVEKLEQALGSEFDLTEVIMIGGANHVIGQPVVQNAKVTVVVTKQTKDRKVIIFKKKRRQGYRLFKTHRQPFTELFVKAIAHNGQVEKTDVQAQVRDIDAERKARIEQRTTDRRERLEAEKKGEAPKPAKQATTKKKAPAKKAAAKKTTKKAPAKKAAKKKTSKSK